MSKRLNLPRALGIFIVGISLSSLSEGLSQTTNYFTWNNSTTTWSTTTAWNPTGGPQSSSATLNTNVAVFAATGAGNNTALLGSDRTVYGLIFTNGANAYTLGSVSTAKQLDIMSGIGLQNVSGQNQIFNLSVANNGTGLWTNSAGSTTTFNNGLNLTTASSSANRTLTLGGAGTWNVASAIANGGTATAGAVTVTATGTTILSGNNTYTGLTTISAGTTILSGNNSAAIGGLVLGGASATLDKPLVKLNSVNAISSSSTISGSSSSDRVGTLDFNAGTAYTLNSYSGGTMNFTNSFGQDSVVTFTNAASTLTSSTGSTGGRSLQNNSANLDIVFNGSLDIGSSQTDTVNTIGGAGDFVVKGNIFSTTVGSVRGLNKTGAGLLEMQGANNSYNGNTTIFNGTISVTNGAVLTGTTVRVAPSSGNSGTLLVNGTAGAVVVSARGILAGGGTVGAVTLESGAILNPGNSPGTLTAASSTWGAGSTYNWEIDQASGGTAGVNWDLFSVVGALDLSALSSGAQMNLVLNSLPSMNDFSSTAEYNWVIAQAGSFIGTGLANGTDVTSLFNINAANFNSGVGPNGGFKVEVGTDANNLRTLNLMAVPEPSTGSMLGLGLAGLVAARLLRRKNS